MLGNICLTIIEANNTLTGGVSGQYFLEKSTDSLIMKKFRPSSE